MIIIADTETTSVDDDREVIQLAYLEVESIAPFKTRDDDNYEPFLGWYMPSKPISLGAMAVHNIIERDLINCPPSSEATLPEGVQYLIGHNIDFDWEGLGKPDCKRICTLAMARHTWPDLETHKLGALIYYLMEHRDAREWLKNAHSALGDCMMTSFLLQKIAEAKNLSTIEEVYAFSESSRIPLKMTFGKHYGMPINQLPATYRTWLLNLPDLNPYLRIALG